MTRFVLLVILTIVAVAVAAWLQRRRPEPPSAPSYRAPRQIDRDDFGPTTKILLAVFASTTCDSCAGVWAKVQALADADVGVERRDVQTDPTLHQRYRIDGVPTTVVVDEEGVVHRAFFGPIADGELEEIIDPLR